MPQDNRPVRSHGLIKKGLKRVIASIIEAYEPEEGFKEKYTEALVPGFLKALVTKADKKLPDLVQSATIFEVNRFGGYRLRQVNSSDEFRAALKEADAGAPYVRKLVESGIKFRKAEKFTEAEKKQLKKLREGDWSDSFNSQDPFNEYIPIMGGPFSHQLYLHDMLDAFAKSFEAYNHNPLAHQVVKITTHFVLGRGVSIKCADADVQKAFQKWWKDKDMNSRLDDWCDMLTRDGELMVRCYTNKVTGELFVRWVDPSTVWEIVTDLEDIERVYYYHQQYPTQYQVLYGAPRDAKFDPSNFLSSKYVINQIPADEMYHLKINCSPNEKRGRSDLFSILSWLKRYKDFQTGVVLKAIIQSTFAWKNKLKGDNADVQAFINAFGTDQPEFGSVWVENGSSDLQPMVPPVGPGNGNTDCPGIINAIAVGSGIPKEYLGITDHGTRATAVVASEPGVKKFQSRQLILGRLLKEIAARWFENEVAAGRIPPMKKSEDEETPGLMVPTDSTIEFQFPEIAVEDRSAKLKDIALVQTSGYISKQRAATMSAKELGISDYNYEEEMEDVTQEQNDAAGALYDQTTGLPRADNVAPNGAGANLPGAVGGTGAGNLKAQPAPSGSLSGQQRRDIKNNDRR